MKNNWRVTPLVLVLLSVLLMSCSGQPHSDMASACQRSLTLAEGKLEEALARQQPDAMSARSLMGTANFASASSLLGAARIQMMVGDYLGCIGLVEQARLHIFPTVMR